MRSNFKATLSLFLHRVCKLIGVEVYYHMRYGVKVLNRKPDEPTSLTGNTLSVDPGRVLFFADGLKDPYSLTGKAIADSPHYFLIKGILEENHSLCQDYIDRERLGALDGRFPLKVTSKSLDAHKNITIRNHQVSCSENYEHPKVVVYEGQYYALDGKHRLAMACYMGKHIECDEVVLKDVLSSRYISKLIKEMDLHPEAYSKNLGLLKSMLNSESQI